MVAEATDHDAAAKEGLTADALAPAVHASHERSPHAVLLKRTHDLLRLDTALAGVDNHRLVRAVDGEIRGHRDFCLNRLEAFDSGLGSSGSGGVGQFHLLYLVVITLESLG